MQTDLCGEKGIPHFMIGHRIIILNKFLLILLVNFVMNLLQIKEKYKQILEEP